MSKRGAVYLQDGPSRRGASREGKGSESRESRRGESREKKGVAVRLEESEDVPFAFAEVPSPFAGFEGKEPEKGNMARQIKRKSTYHVLALAKVFGDKGDEDEDDGSFKCSIRDDNGQLLWVAKSKNRPAKEFPPWERPATAEKRATELPSIKHPTERKKKQYDETCSRWVADQIVIFEKTKDGMPVKEKEKAAALKKKEKISPKKARSSSPLSIMLSNSSSDYEINELRRANIYHKIDGLCLKEVRNQFAKRNAMNRCEFGAFKDAMNNIREGLQFDEDVLEKVFTIFDDGNGYIDTIQMLASLGRLLISPTLDDDISYMFEVLENGRGFIVHPRDNLRAERLVKLKQALAAPRRWNDLAAEWERVLRSTQVTFPNRISLDQFRVLVLCDRKLAEAHGRIKPF